MIGKRYRHKTSASFIVKVLGVAEGGVFFKGQYFDAISLENFEKNYELIPAEILPGQYRSLKGFSDLRVIVVAEGWCLCAQGDTIIVFSVGYMQDNYTRIGDLQP